jgi:hypothetical protein
MNFWARGNFFLEWGEGIYHIGGCPKSHVPVGVPRILKKVSGTVLGS